MPRTSEPGRSVSSRLLDVLFAFEPGRSEMNLSDLARHTGMPFATVRRYALELAEAGALERNAQGTFTVSLKLWRLGTLAPFTEPLRSLAQPFTPSWTSHGRTLGLKEPEGFDLHGRWLRRQTLGPDKEL